MSLVGHTFREWTLHEEMARGGMGVIYRATHAFLGGEFAIKTLLESADEEGKERFFREARTAASLKHPNIVQTFPPFLEGGVFFLPMELLRGNSLQTLMRAVPDPWPVHVATAYIAQAAAGLGHAHAQGVMHRDVKPGNLVVLEDGHSVKVLDFGLARSMQSATLTEDGVKVGTPVYIAPEVIDGQKASAQSDLYALGVVFFRLLTKQLPFELPSHAKSDFALVRHIRGVQAAGLPRVDTLRDDVPQVIADVIASMLAEDPAKRPASARELSLRLGTGLGDPPEWAKRHYAFDGTEVEPRPPPLPSAPPSTAPKPRLGSPWAFVGLALLSAAAVAGTLLLISR